MTPQIEQLLAHAEWLRRLAAHVARGDSEDIVQDTWVAALRSPPDPARPPRAWLAEVLRNFARRRARRARRRPELSSEAVPTPEALLERAEAQRLLAELVVALPEPYRGTVMLRYHEGLSSAEIAAAQGVPAGTVRWRLKEALDRLRAGLDARDERRSWLVLLRRPAITGALLMTKAKVGMLAGIAIVLLAGGGAVWRARPSPESPVARAGPRRPFVDQRLSGVIEGVVRVPDGPSAGATVALIVDGSYDEMEDKTALRPLATVTSSASGAFRFTAVPSGRYLLTATASGWAPAEAAVTAAAPVTRVELRLATGAARVTGVVSDAGSGVLGSAGVRALALGAGGRPDGVRTFVAATDGRGHYELRVPPGGYRVVADAEGYAPQGASLWIAVDQRRDFRLAPAARVSGRVLERGEPAPSIEVRLDALGAASSRRTLTDATGTFLVANLPAGRYSAWARGGSLAGRAPQTIAVAPGGLAEVTIELARAAAITGTTRDEGGRAVAGARIAAGIESVVSDRDGRFRLEGLPAGRHGLTYEAPGYRRDRQVVAVETADVAVALVLALETRVRGRVWDGDGRPLPGASVLVSEDLPADLTVNFGLARTGEDGRFEVRGLGPGEVFAEAEHPSAGRGIAGPLRLEGAAVRELDIRLGGGGLVRGTVRFDDGQPATAVVVRGWVKGRRTVATVTDQQGRYELGPFTPAEVHVNAWPETDALGMGGSPDTERVMEVAADRNDVDLTIPRRDQEITGAVLSPDGTPLTGAAVGVSPNHRGASFRPYQKDLIAIASGNYGVLSDGAGAFTLRFLPAGKYTLWATHPDYPEADAYDVLAGARGVRLRFARGATLAGVATDSSGPIASYTVHAALSADNDVTPQLIAARGEVQQTAIVQDASGAFEVTGLPAALYDVVVRTPDRRIGFLAHVPLAAGEARRGLHVLVGPGTRVRGRLVYADSGAAATGLGLGASFPGGQSITLTDAAGRFLLEGLPSGPISLNLPGNPRTRKGQTEDITIPAGTTELDVGTLRLTKRPTP